MRGLVNLDRPCLQNIIRSKCPAPAQEGLHTRNQNLRAEWLRHIVVNSELKAKRLVPLIRFGRQHDDRYLRLLPDLADDLPAVHFRHHDIQNDQRNIPCREKLVDCLGAISGFDDFKILLDQEVPDKLPHPFLIIDDHYLQCFHRSILLHVFIFCQTVFNVKHPPVCLRNCICALAQFR